MDLYYLENLSLKVTINRSGAELVRILNKENGKDYLWNGDEAYWKRHAPVLFPIVGSLKNHKFIVDGTDYPMGQHGFARDMDFRLVKQNGKEITFRLTSNEETMKVYPYPFILEIRYVLTGKRILTEWTVKNPGEEPIHFQIGGHPAFNCPLNKKEKMEDSFLAFDTDQPIRYRLLNENGLLEDEVYTLETDGGLLPIDPHMFDRDALIIEDHQVNKVSILGPDRMERVSVSFNSPLFGLWSPAGKNAPFLCIEPWYGRADRADFAGSIEKRDYDNRLLPGEVFSAEFTIEIE